MRLSRLPILSAGLVASAAILGLQVQKSTRLRPPVAGAPPVWAVGIASDVAGKMPARPFEGQARPPCKGSQVVVNGGCWYRVTPEKAQVPDGAVCSMELFEHNGACYLPVKAMPAPNVSGE